MKLIEKKDNQISFQAEIEETLANAIRRYINQIPVLAVDEVEIIKNDSPLYDETIAHRIGLIPLKMNKSINEKSEINFELNPKKQGFVYSEDLKGKIPVVYEKIPITSLNKGQELEIKAIARVGKGVDHQKFSPGTIFYRNLIDIKITGDCPTEIIDTCPKRIFQIEKGKIVVKNSYKCDLCESCLEFCKKNGKDSIKLTPTNELIITLESFGQLSIEEIFEKSIEVLKKDLSELSKKI